MNKIFRIVWSEVSQAWIAVSELTKSHKKRASATAVAVALVAGMLSPFAEASNTESDPAKNLEPSELGTDYYFRVTTANTGEPDDLEHYNGCRNGNADSACPDTEMNIGVLDKDSAPTEDNSDNSRLVLEGNKGIRLKKAEDKSHKITFDAPVEVADGSGAVSIEQPVTGDKAGHTIIKSEIKSGNDKIKVTSENGVTTITWVGGDTAGGGAAGGSTSVTAGDGISVSADNKVSVNAKANGGITVDANGVSVNAKANGGISLDGGVSVDTDNTTINVANGKVSAVTGAITAGNNASVADADKGKLAKAGEVAAAINAAKTSVTNADATTTVTQDGNVYKVAAKVETNKGLETTNGLAVKQGSGITVDANGVSVNAKANGGISLDGGVSVDTDNTTINVANGKVSAVTGAITAGNNASVADADKGKLAKAGEVAAAINAAKTSVTNADATTTVTQDGNVYKVAAKVETNKGLETTNGLAVKQGSGITVNNDGVSVHAKDNGGLTVGADGVSVTTDGTTIKLDDAGKVSAVTGAITAGDNAGVADADKGKLAKAGDVVEAINAAKTSVTNADATTTVTHDGNVYKVAAKVAENKGLDKTTDGLAVKQGSGITVNNDGVSVHAKDNGGLTVGADGVSVTTDGTTIKLDDAGKVSAVTGAITAGDNAGVADADKGKLAKAGDVVEAINAAKTSVTNADATTTVTHDGNVYKVAAKVAENKGLDKTTDGLAVKQGSGITVNNDGVSVHAKDNGGLTVGADGVSVTTDGTTIKLDDAGKVSAVTGAITAGVTPSVDTADENKLATAGNVAKAINAAKVKVEAGSGISVEHNPVLNAYTVSAPFEKTENDKGTTVTFKGKTTAEHPNGETKLTGIAAGDISPTSSDAVNGAQIYGLNRGATTKVENVTIGGNTYNNVIVSNDGKNTPLLKTYNTQDKRTVLTNSVYEAIYNMNEYGIKFFHVNDGTENAKKEGHSENDSSASGKYATAIGALSDASGQNAVAMGFGSKVTGDNSIAIGTGNKVDAAKSGAFGDPNIINGKDVNNVAVSGSYAVGNDNIIDSSNTFVLGNDINNKGNSTAVGHTVENSVYLGNKTTARGGDGSQTAKLKNIKHDGSEGTTTTAGSIGTVNEAIVNGMSYGGFAGAKGHGVVSVGAADAERRIQNVAAGEISATSTDAINGSQLYSISSRLGNNMNRLNDRINKVGKRADAGTASAIATANLLQSYRPGLSAATAAVGQYRGQSAIAVGYSRLSDNGKYGVKFSLGANTQGNVGAGAGVAYFW
ncbi:ESPR-type extended signal peptide-containing protein [Haemophilus haemolyticus]|uniref:ESPR-type extended signal peptide-containing protein n=1 Tax=Haemophilus haemolyticus TaxID=726 RepID=UPI000E58ECC3|nr:ESPR-type extended signal peptide-containing protein [Haemophilus haemolyticus]